MSNKSGLKTLKQGEVLFEDGARADSLYIIQKGQIRLYKPKGRGFIEIAVIRPGEVIGEMAYFDAGKGRTRSCAAEALVASEVIEVSFAAFGKQIEGLNPWFKTIFTTLATRLRATNNKVKQLESNNVSMGYGSDGSDYQFFQSKDVVKCLSVLFLVMTAHAERTNAGYELHTKTLNFYAQDIFNVVEVKFLEFLNLFKELQLANFKKDADGFEKVFVVKDLAMLRSLMIFFNTQRITEDAKKIKISSRCEVFLDSVMKKAKEQKLQGKVVQVEISDILQDFKTRNVNIDVQDLDDAKKNGFVSEPVVGSKNELILPVNLALLEKNYTAIVVMNAVEKFNRSKQKSKYE